MQPQPPVPPAAEAALRRCIAPADEAACIPPACYADEAHLAAEQARIFRGGWVGIGRADRFRAAGDYETMEIGGVPVIVLRDEAGGLRCFSNSCRHRGARLLDGAGTCRGIKCPFHGWAYRLDGSLAGVPHMEDARGFDRDEHGLIEFPTGECLGFAFICLDGQAPPLEEQLGNFAELHSPWPIGDLVSTRRRSVEVACNWKAFLDVFNEYYHLPYIHPRSINGLYGTPRAGDAATGAFATQYGPITGSGGVLEGEQEHALPHMAGLTGEARTGVRYTWVFPNMTFAAGQDALWLYEAYPLSAGRCLAVQTVCFPPQTVALSAFETQAGYYYHRMDAALDEDIVALENQQRGMNSPFARQGRFSPVLESNVAAFASWYAGRFLGNGSA